VNGGKAQRLTFDGKYNAAADVSPDGRYMTLINNSGNGYRVAVMDMQSKAMRVISDGNLDEAPSFAPNGISCRKCRWKSEAEATLNGR